MIKRMKTRLHDDESAFWLGSRKADKDARFRLHKLKTRKKQKYENEESFSMFLKAKRVFLEQPIDDFL